MNLLLDQGLPRSAAELLREAGLDAVHTGECGLSTASDADIIAFARAHRRTIVTLDADFHALMSMGGWTSPSVIRIRVEGLKGPEAADLIRQILRRGRKDIASGALVSATIDQIRFHKLPIVPRPRRTRG